LPVSTTSESPSVRSASGSRSRHKRNDEERYPVQLPYTEPLTTRELADPVIPEPPRRGDPGGEPCGVCPGEEGPHTIWSDDNWILSHGLETSLAGAVWLATRTHVDSFADLDSALAQDFGVLSGRIDRALLALPDVARTHVYRWGDGGSPLPRLVPAPSAGNAAGAKDDAPAVGGGPAPSLGGSRLRRHAPDRRQPQERRPGPWPRANLRRA
jgi:hypothetical protein